MGDQATLRDSVKPSDDRRGSEPAPGLLLLFSMGQPRCVPLPLQKGQLELGRSEAAGPLADPKMSRRHAAVSYNGERFQVTDLGSQNGTFVDGVKLEARASTTTGRLVRAGDSLFLLCSDLSACRDGVEQRGPLFLGGGLRAAFAQAARAAQFGRTLHITGESGSGKEGVARAFHGAGRAGSAPFVPVNCATIPAGVAERVLFGARKGAFSGAVADTDGLIQSADGGTLFLDEIAELDLAVQAKLLRVLETREVLPIGGLRPRLVDVLLCSASHRDLRGEVTQGRFREDLYFRINSPEVIVPPLRQRLEEIPFLIDSVLRSLGATLAVHSSFVEVCLLRTWPGNLRELLAEVRAAAQNALGQRQAKLEPSHLSERAGQPLERAAAPRTGCAVIFHPPINRPPRALPEPAQIESVLAQAGGNISAAARMLGLHRTQLTRLMDKHHIRAGQSEHGLDEEG